jgi:DNA polymerase V
VATLGKFAEKIDVYSIDEAFFEMPDDVAPEARIEFCREIRETVLRNVGIPVTIGSAPTMTLAKFANRLAKSAGEGELEIDPFSAECRDALESAAPADVWGIGRGGERRLLSAGITNALRFRESEAGLIRRLLGVAGLRTAFELRGVSAISLDDETSDRKSVRRSRSFGRPTRDIREIRGALSRFTGKARATLRSEGLSAGLLTVFLKTKVPSAPKGSVTRSSTASLSGIGDSPSAISTVVDQLLAGLFREGDVCVGAGVVFGEITPSENQQPDLFQSDVDSEKWRRVWEAVDEINAASAPGAGVFLAAEGVGSRLETRRSNMSRRFSTRWDELLRVS